MTADAAHAMLLLDARIDKLTAALLHVSSELWATRDRQAVLERLLTDEAIRAPGLIDGYSPDALFAKKLEADREMFVANILSYLAPDT